MTIAPENKLKGILFACTAALCWGFLPIAIKIALRFTDSETIVWARFTIATSILLVYYLIVNPQQLRIVVKPPFLLLVATFGLGANYLAFAKSLDYTSPENSQIFIQIGPVSLAFVGFLYYKEKARFLHYIGFLSVVVGLLIFYSIQLNNYGTNDDLYNAGVLWVIFAAFTWLLYAIAQKQLVQKHPVLLLNVVIFGLPAIFYFFLADMEALSTFSPLQYGLLIFLGINTLIAYGSMSFALKYLEANKASTIIICNPVLTFILMAILDWASVSWITPENLTPTSIIGASLVLTGAILAIGVKKNKNKNEKS